MGKGGKNGCSIGDCKGHETTLSDAILMDTCHSNLAQVHSMHTTNSEPYVNYGSQ